MHYKAIKGCVFAVLSAIIYGCMPLMAKHIYNDGVNPITLVFLRNVFSLAPLAILAYGEQKTLKIPSSLLPSIGMISLLGCCITPILLFSSYRFIPSGLATVYHYAYPSFVVIAEILFLRKRIRPSGIVSVLLCALGIGMFYTPQQTFNLTGAALALLSAMTFSGYVVLLSHFDAGKISGFLFSFYITLVSSIATFIICIVTDQLALPATRFGWGLCILFSILVTTGAVVLFQKSTFLIGGESASILSTLEPITSVIIGVVVFNEPFGIWVLIGTILVVLASTITVFFSLMKKEKSA